MKRISIRLNNCESRGYSDDRLVENIQSCKKREKTASAKKCIVKKLPVN